MDATFLCERGVLGGTSVFFMGGEMILAKKSKGFCFGLFFIVASFYAGNLLVFDHLFFHPELHFFDNNHLLVGSTTAILASLLIATLCAHVNSLSRQLNEKVDGISNIDNNNAIFKVISENSTDMIHFNDASGKILYVNPVTYDLLGYRSNEIINEPADKFIHQDDQEIIRQDMRQVVSGANISPREIRLLKKDGGTLDVEVKGFAVRESDKVKYIGAILRDISSRKYKLKLLRDKEEWEEAFDTISDFVSVHDENFKVVKANKALCELLDMKLEEIIGSDCFRLFHNTEKPFLNCPHKKAIETGHPITVDINDPNIGVPLQITCSPFFDKEGAFKGSVHVARNITGADNRAFYRSKKLLPICAWCKDIREDENTYTKIEQFIEENTKFKFTHTICKECQVKIYPKYFNKENN